MPIDRIGPIIGELIRERWPHGGGNEILAEKIGCDESAIWGIVAMERTSADFDLVDNLLCALGRPDLWRGVFRDIYLSLTFLPEAEREHLPAKFKCGHPNKRSNLRKAGVKNGVQYYRCASCNTEHQRNKRRLARAA